MIRRFRPLVPLVAPYRPAIALGFAAVVLTQAVQGYLPLAFKHSIDALTGPAPDPGLATLWAGVFFAATGVRGVFQYLMRSRLVGVSRQLERRLRDRLYERVLARSPAWLARRHTGDLLSRFTSDVEAVRMSVGPGLMYVANTAVIFPLAVFLMWRMSPLLTVLNLVPLLGVAVGTRLAAPRMHSASVAMQEAQASMSMRAQESFAGVRVVKSFAREEREVATFREVSERSLAANLRFVDVRALFHPLIGLMKWFGLVLTVFVGGLMMARGELTLGTFFAFHGWAGMLMWPMISLGWVMALWERGKVAMERLRELLEEPADILDPAEPVELGEVRGELEVRGLTFTYAGAPAPALVDVSLHVPAGRTLAIFGPTGAGKSTLLALIPRLAEPPPGTILLDGVPVERLRLDALRSSLSYVPQDTFLFSDTVGNNVGFGLEAGADASAAIREAAAKARVLEEVERLPQGFDTLLGERGVNLSGGQRQRAAIARALAVDAPVLLLDDCLSAVDARTESEILGNLREILGGRTTVLVTHRVSAARLADEVVVLDEGRVVERGTHEELLRGDGLYARIARRQSLEAALEAA